MRGIWLSSTQYGTENNKKVVKRVAEFKSGVIAQLNKIKNKIKTIKG